LREQLKLLEDLQQVDLKLEQTEQALAVLPKKLDEIKKDVGRVDALLDEERRHLAEAQRYKASLEQELKAEQERLHKAKAKMSQVRTSKEYLAVQREFEANRRLSTERNEEINKLNAAIEQFQQSISTHEEELNGLKDHVAQEESDTTSQIGDLSKSAETQRDERKSMAEAVRKDVLRKYDTIRKRRGGLAVVAAHHGVCSGCNMQLPPQLYNIIQRANSIEQCPNCHRIIYYPEPEAETEQRSDA
jgi:predicted  nucleic acid-binding Zn-ribbon protein